MQALKKVTLVFDWVVKLFAVLSAVIIVFLMLLVCMEVIMRYFFRRPMTGFLEVSEYCLLFMTFLIATWLLKREGHVKLDLVAEWLEPRTLAVVNSITSFMCTIVCFILTWYGVEVAWDYFQMNYHLSTEIRPAAFLIVAIIPIGCFLLLIQCLRRTYGFMKSITGNNDSRR